LPVNSALEFAQGFALALRIRVGDRILPMPQESDRSHLFVVRVWSESSLPESATEESTMAGSTTSLTNAAGCPDDLPLEIRGRVQHALSGETRHFRDWPTLIEFLISQVAQLDAGGDESDAA
jgi:hypothetical protein